MADFKMTLPHAKASMGVVIGTSENQRNTHRTDEDGYPIIKSVFNLLVVGDDGSRYSHCEGSEDLSDIEALEAEWVGKLKAGGALDLEVWEEIEPSYGSLRYQNGGGEEELVAFESRVEQEEMVGLR
jgi:hypothetical protein